MSHRKERGNNVSVEWHNLLWGVRYGCIFAACYCAIALVIFAVGGEQSYRSYGVTFGQTIALYITGGLLGGAVVGLLRPLTKTWLGAAFVGVVAAIPISWMGMRAVGVTSRGELLVGVGVLSLGWGVIGGLSMHRIFSKRRRLRAAEEDKGEPG